MKPPCVDLKCSVPRDRVEKTYWPYPVWLRMPDPIVEHCECGRHPRTFTKAQLIALFR